MWKFARVAAGLGVLVAVVWRVGSGPVLDGLRAVHVGSVVAAVLLTLATTVCSAWRWALIARGVGVALPLHTAIAACYRSQFLNTVLPGGVVGDVHRALRHGRDAGDVSRAVRAVVWERTAGQLVQLVLTATVLVALPSPVRPLLPDALGAIAVAVAVGVLVVRHTSGGRSRWARAARTARADVRGALLARHAWPGVVGASVLIVAGHAAVFMIVARATGVTESTMRLLPLVLVVQLAAAVPTNIAGWGPREGIAAWLFAAAGSSAATGVAAATGYGVLVFIAALPGAAVLVVAWLRDTHRQDSGRSGAQAPRLPEGVVGG